MSIFLENQDMGLEAWSVKVEERLQRLETISDKDREQLTQAFRDAGFVDLDDDTLPTWGRDPAVWRPVEALVDTVIDAGWLPTSIVGDLQASEAELVSAPLRKEIERLQALARIPPRETFSPPRHTSSKWELR